MEITIDLDKLLVAEARKLATESNRSLDEVVADALREYLAIREPLNKREPVRLHTFKGEGVRPGVDLNDMSALLDLMDEYES